MNAIKRVTTLVGVIALAASSLLASDAMAQGIGTTITVDNTPACVDNTPTSLVLNAGAETRDFGALSGGSPSSGVFAAQVPTAGAFIEMNLYVNECLGQSWRVDAAITDFHSGPNSVSPVGKLQMYANTSAYQLPVRPNPPFVPYTVANQVPGTTGMPLAGGTFNTAREFTNVAPNVNSGGTVSTGNAAANGNMLQGIKMRLHSVPHTTPSGTYEAVLTFTFVTTGP